jgi:hypothetical protein
MVLHHGSALNIEAACSSDTLDLKLTGGTSPKINIDKINMSFTITD